MRSWLRAGRLMLGIGWETGPAVFLTFVLSSVVASLTPLVFAFGLKLLVDGIYYDRRSSLVLGAVVTALSLLVAVAGPYVNRWVVPRLRERSIMVMQRRLLALNTAAPGLEHLERHDFWDRLQLLKRNFGDLLMGMANLLVGALLLVQLVVTTVILGRLQPVLLALPLLAFPAAWLSNYAENLKRAAERRVAQRRRSVEHLFTLASSAQAAKEIRIYRLPDELVARHRRTAEEIRRTMEVALSKAAGLTLLGMAVFAAGYLGAIVIALRAAVTGRLTPGAVALTLALVTAVVASAGRLSDLTDHLLRAVAVADNYHWLTERAAPPDPEASRRAAVPTRVVRGYELENVSFRYAGSDRLALDGATLRLEAGTVVAVVGENGAGKTTLVKLLSRMYTPTQGRILLDGVDIQRFDMAEYRRRLSAAFQDFVRFELLAGESVGIGDLARLDDRGAVRTALDRAGAEFAERLAGGLDTQLGRSWEHGVDLSGGEWQKLALARAMMRQHPLLLIFDEPTASLDPQTEHALFERVAAGARDGREDGRITLLISHRFSTVRMADVIVVLDRGRVLEQGSHAELMARGGLYAELCGLQAKAYAR